MKKLFKKIAFIILLSNIIIYMNSNYSNAVQIKNIRYKNGIVAKNTEKNIEENIENIENLENNIKFINNIEDKNEVEDTLKNIILTITSEGINRNWIQQLINLYSEIAIKYDNNEIANMLEKNIDEFKKNNVNIDKINSVIKVLNKFETESLKRVVENINVEDIANKIKNGESLQNILIEITKDLTLKQKIDLVIEFLFSESFLKTSFKILIILFVYKTLLRCVIYKKAKKRAWAAFIPIYRNVTMLRICNMSPWWLLLLLVPVLGWLILFVISVSSKFMLAEGFGKGTFFAFGLCFFPTLFETIIVFSKETKYIGFEEENYI